MFCPISLNLTQFTQNRGSENGKRSQHGLNKHRQNPDQVMFGENHSSGQLCVEYCLENKWASTKSKNNISGQAPNTNLASNTIKNGKKSSIIKREK